MRVSCKVSPRVLHIRGYGLQKTVLTWRWRWLGDVRVTRTSRIQAAASRKFPRKKACFPRYGGGAILEGFI
jgi:hypothetical protein